MQVKAIQQVSELVESVLSNSGLFLVDVEIKGAGQPVVWVYIDGHDRSVRTDECAEISKELSFLLDAHDIFQGRYRLNVSSPGLARPLTDRRQYHKNKGRKARIKFRADGEYRKAEGILRDIQDKEIVIENEDGTLLTIAFDQVVETKIIPSI